jgi:hypothetical protein
VSVQAPVVAQRLEQVPVRQGHPSYKANSASSSGSNGDNGNRAKTGKSDRHGDQNAMSKAEKQIEKLKGDLEKATSKSERNEIKKKIQNITEIAQKRAKGESHWMK